MDPFADLVRALTDMNVRFVVFGVWGANYYAPSGQALFSTLDRDLFLPLDVENLLRSWTACDGLGLALWAGHDPLDSPRDRTLADAVVRRRARTRASDGHGMDVDLSLVMTGFDFEAVWADRHTFVVDGVDIPVARLAHIVESKQKAGRRKDQLFLEAHKDALRQLLGDE